MDPIVRALENVVRVAKTSAASSDEKAAREAIGAVRALARELKTKTDAAQKTLLERLDTELATWQDRIAVIWKEPIGRQGMAKHAHYWVEQLNKFSG